MSPWPVDADVDGGPPAAARPRRPRGRHEVRPDRRARRARARERARDGGARRRRRALQGVPRASSASRSSRTSLQIGIGARPRLSRSRWRSSASRPSTTRRCAASTRRRRRRWSSTSTSSAGRTSRSAASSRSARSASSPGLGSHVSWEERLDGRLAGALCSIQAIKGVGARARASRSPAKPGSQAHDEIFHDPARAGFYRETNHAGGLEGGMTTGETLIVTRGDEAAADADQAAALGRHRDARAGRGAARAHRLLHGARPRASSARRWSRSSSPTPTGASSAATTSTTCARRSPPTGSGSGERARRVVLIGFMGAGKTTAARDLAALRGPARASTSTS